MSRTGFGGELGYELFCRPEHAADLWDVVVTQMRAVPFGVGLIEVLRVEAGLIVLDYDYEAHQRTPFDLSLDRMVALGNVDFHGGDALEAVAEDPPRRMKTLRSSGEELPGLRGRGPPGTGRRGRHADQPGRRARGSAGSRWPSWTPTMAADGTELEVELATGHGAGHGRPPGHLRPGEEAAAHVTRGPVADGVGDIRPLVAMVPARTMHP